MAGHLATAEAQRLLDALRDDRLEALIRLMLATGLRRGEALALRWSDVDLDRQALRVRWTLSRTSAGLVLGEPKTEKSGAWVSGRVVAQCSGESTSFPILSAHR
jgi:integrase